VTSVEIALRPTRPLFGAGSLSVLAVSARDSPLPTEGCQPPIARPAKVYVASASVITVGYCDIQNWSIRYRERNPLPSHLARRRRKRMSRQRYVVTGVSRGTGAEIAGASVSWSPSYGVRRGSAFSWFRRLHTSRSFGHGVDHVGCVQDLAAARVHRMTDGELPWSQAANLNPR
jgi:hypothetical protein